MSKRIKKRFTIFDGEGGDPRTVELVGRFAWALGQLIDARSKGITTLENAGAATVGLYPPPAAFVGHPDHQRG